MADTTFELMLAQDKMMKEMSEEHTPTEDIIHNWLCEQEDDEDLLIGILKNDRTIKGALAYITAKAKKLYSSQGSVAAIDSYTVFPWVREYFVSNEIELPSKAVATVAASAGVPSLTSKEKQVAKSEEDDQMNIFDFLEEEK